MPVKLTVEVDFDDAPIIACCLDGAATMLERFYCPPTDAVEHNARARQARTARALAAQLATAYETEVEAHRPPTQRRRTA
jgi:hypothetical protein